MKVERVMGIEPAGPVFPLSCGSFIAVPL